MTLEVARVSVGVRRHGVIVESPRPSLGWIVESDAADWRQRGATIELTTSAGVSVHEHASDESVAVAWPFPPLRARERGSIRVRVRGENGDESEWSRPVDLVCGCLDDQEWVAQYIELPDPGDMLGRPARFRTEFELDEPVVSAYLYSSAQGVYQIEINGAEADDHLLKPGWTAYESRLALEVTDVTSLIRRGRNAIGIQLAGGWYTLQHYGPQPSVAAQLVIELASGAQQVIGTGAAWSASASGPVVETTIYNGESYDARLADRDWSLPGFAEQGWHPAVVRPSVPAPEPTTMPPTRRIQELAVAEVLTSAKGKLVVDFGQNIAGWVRLSVDGPSGTRITLRHAEVMAVLDDDEVYERILFNAKVTDTLILDGEPIVWEPSTTFHGFRYVEIDGWPGTFDLRDVTAIVVHSDMKRTGWFSSSNELLNRFHENAVWSMKANFLSLPTDCPQRAERRGWTGDVQVFGPTASFLHDCEGFLRSWLRDLEADQVARGGVPIIVPAHRTWPGEPFPAWAGPVAGWSDASTIVPTTLFERFGDVSVIRDQLQSMRLHVESVLSRADPDLLWTEGLQFGDWLDPTAPPAKPSLVAADAAVVSTAYFFRSASLLARAASLANDEELAGWAGELAERIRSAWLDAYTTASGRIVSDAPTAYALALVFEIERDLQRRRLLGDRLAVLVRRRGYTIATGVLGTPYVTDALTQTGHLDVAARLLLQTDCPSWLYPVTMGATTIWERWDSLLEDGSVNPGWMTSFNHYALGAVADWLHRTVAGLGVLDPGYRRLLVEPKPIPTLEFASATHLTPYGTAEVGWSVQADGTILVRARIPANASALVRLPGRVDEVVGSGEHEWTIEDTRGALPPLLARDTRVDVASRHEEELAELLRVIGSGIGPELFIESAQLIPDAPLRGQLASMSPPGVMDRFDEFYPRG